MPSKSRAQHRMMCAAAHGKGRSRIPKKVAKEYCDADRGRNISKLPERVKQKKRRR